MIGVIANYRDYKVFLDRWIDPEDREKFKQISRQEDIRGIILTEVIRVGDYETVENWEELSHYAYTRIRPTGETK